MAHSYTKDTCGKGPHSRWDYRENVKRAQKKQRRAEAKKESKKEDE